ncbi:MAG: FAD-dependent oxidoreductase [Caldivirga sp.]|nr:FAD-dependent oxidoreductase [Caldivirga sp.]
MKFALKCSPGQKIAKRQGRVAIIGAGPAGLGAAGYLICKGYDVDVYDRMPEPGGMMLFAIPNWRLPWKNVRAGVEELRELGVNFFTNVKVICDDEYRIEGDQFVKSKVHLEELIDRYDAVIIATGTWESRRLRIPGEDLKGSYLALDYLFRIYASQHGYLPKSEVYKTGLKSMVVGAGLTAVDAAIESQLEGAREVYLSYRRTINEAPAGKAEINRLIQRGVKLMELTLPVEVSGKEAVEAVKLVKMRLGKPDASGRPAPEPIPGSEFVVSVDTLISAIGEIPTPPMRKECCGVTLRQNGTIDTDAQGRTRRLGVFAAGDVTNGPTLIGKALAHGMRIAQSVEAFLEAGGKRGGSWRS